MKLITTALIAAKSQFNPIHKNKINPHFKSKYATLDEILEAIAPDDDDDGTTAKAPATVKTTSLLPKAGESSGDDCVLSQTASRSTVNREIELRKLMTELNLPSRTITELVKRHFGIDHRINSMTPAEFIQLLTLMRQTATLTTHNKHQTNGVVRENVTV